jgi:hypothetical protein
MFHLAAGSAWLGGMFTGCTQITLLRLAVSARSLRRKTVHNGGYRAMPAASNHHAARLVFQSASVLIADSVSIGHRAGGSHAAYRTSSYRHPHPSGPSVTRRHPPPGHGMAGAAAGF